MRLTSMIVLAAFLATAMGGAKPSVGQSSVPLAIAILDVNRVFQNALAVKAIQAKLRAYVEAYRSDAEKEEEEIVNAQQKLGKDRSVLSPEAYEAERHKLEQRLVEAQGKVQRRKYGLDQAQQQGMVQVQATLNRIVTEIANEKGLTLILRKDQTVLNATALEITDEVLRRLNAELPSVEVAEPGNP